MHQIPLDPSMREFIQDEIIVDAHGDYEIALAWSQHMADTIRFPFRVMGAVDQGMTGSRQVKLEIVGFHPRVQEHIDQIWFLAHLPGQDLYFAIRPEELGELELPEEDAELDEEAWEMIESLEETVQSLEAWRYWTTHMVG